MRDDDGADCGVLRNVQKIVSRSKVKVVVRITFTKHCDWAPLVSKSKDALQHDGRESVGRENNTSLLLPSRPSLRRPCLRAASRGSTSIWPATACDRPQICARLQTCDRPSQPARSRQSLPHTRDRRAGTNPNRCQLLRVPVVTIVSEAFLVRIRSK